jgi:LmbE family N-acetylglucosaminyl deacetylase
LPAVLSTVVVSNFVVHELKRRADRQQMMCEVARIETSEWRVALVDFIFTGLLEFEDRKAVVENLVRWIRKLRPDVLFAWDPGKNHQRWHKSDHRAAYLAVDGARAAMWRLLFEGQITQEGLKEHMIPEYLFFNDYDYGDENITADISDFVEKKVNAGAKYIRQFGPGWKNYKPDLSETVLKEMKELTRKRVRMKDGKAFEGFGYYRGLPDGLGK